MPADFAAAASHELIEARLIKVDGLQVAIPDIARLHSYGT